MILKPPVILSCILAVACLLFLEGEAEGFTRAEASALAGAGLAEVDSLLEAGNPEGAVRKSLALQDQLGDDPLYGWQITGRLGLALLRAGRPEEALPHLEAVMRQDPNDPVGHRNFAAALLALGRRGRALSEFRIVVELAPDDYAGRLEYGQVLAEFGDADAACAQLEVARHLCPECLEPDQVMAGVLLKARRYGDAVAPLERLMTADPTPAVRLQLFQALAGAGRDEDLLELAGAQASHGLHGPEMNLVIEAEGRLGRDAWSLACVGAASGKEGPPGGLPEPLLTDPAFWGRISLNLLETGHFPEWLLAADRAVDLAPDNVVYRNNRVVLLLKLGRDEDAAREWAAVLELDPSLEAKESE
jgi:tetratricopeptide (TPR) repeat protein